MTQTQQQPHPEITVEATPDGYLVRVGDAAEPILRTQNVLQEALRIAPALGVEPKSIVAAVARCVDDEVDAILNSPRPLEKLKPHLDEQIAGEDANKQLLFVLLLSGKMPDPRKKEMILFKSESGAGKSTLANALTAAFNTKKVGRFSEHALDYTDLSGYQVLYIQEIGHMDEERQGLSTIKFLSADDQGYTVEVTVGNPQEGFTTETKRIPPLTVISSTTRVRIDPQYERRNWIISLDETPEQTKRIMKLKAKQRLEENEINLGLRDELSSDRAKRLLKRLVEKIEPCRVCILFPESILEVLQHEKIRVRGDYSKLMRLIEYYCILRQRTLPRLTINGTPTVFATPEAALEILRVASEPLTLMTMEMDRRTRKLLEGFKEIGLHSAGEAITPELREEMAIKLGYSSRTIRAYLSELVNKGYLTDDGRKPKTYRLAMSLKAIERKVSAISAKLENTDELLLQICEEAQKTLKRLSAKMEEGELKKLIDTFTPKVSPPPKPVFADPELGKGNRQTQELPQNQRQFQPLPKNMAPERIGKTAQEGRVEPPYNLAETLEQLRETLWHLQEKVVDGPVPPEKLMQALGWSKDFLERVSRVAEREPWFFRYIDGRFGYRW